MEFYWRNFPLLSSPIPFIGYIANIFTHRGKEGIFLATVFEMHASEAHEHRNLLRQCSLFARENIKRSNLTTRALARFLLFAFYGSNLPLLRMHETSYNTLICPM